MVQGVVFIKNTGKGVRSGSLILVLVYTIIKSFTVEDACRVLRTCLVRIRQVVSVPGFFIFAQLSTLCAHVQSLDLKILCLG